MRLSDLKTSAFAQLLRPCRFIHSPKGKRFSRQSFYKNVDLCFISKKKTPKGGAAIPFSQRERFLAVIFMNFKVIVGILFIALSLQIMYWLGQASSRSVVGSNNIEVIIETDYIGASIISADGSISTANITIAPNNPTPYPRYQYANLNRDLNDPSSFRGPSDYAFHRSLSDGTFAHFDVLHTVDSTLGMKGIPRYSLEGVSNNPQHVVEELPDGHRVFVDFHNVSMRKESGLPIIPESIEHRAILCAIIGSTVGGNEVSRVQLRQLFTEYKAERLLFFYHSFEDAKKIGEPSPEFREHFGSKFYRDYTVVEAIYLDLNDDGFHLVLVEEKGFMGITTHSRTYAVHFCANSGLANTMLLY
jgi:hypothetical protein